MNNWAFQIARCVFESDIRIRKPSWWFKVWVYLIWKANHKDNKQFKRWQCRVTYDKIYTDCHLWQEWVKKSAIKNVIARMKKEWKLTTQKTTRGMIITIVKYNDYQTLDNYSKNTAKNSERTHKEHTNHTINKNDKNVEEWKEVISKKKIPPSIQEVTEYCEERKNGIDPQMFIDHYQANWWMRWKNKIKDWKACVRTWERRRDNKPRTDEEWIKEYDKMCDNRWAEFKAKYWQETYQRVKQLYKEYKHQQFYSQYK